MREQFLFTSKLVATIAAGLMASSALAQSNAAENEASAEEAAEEASLVESPAPADAGSSTASLPTVATEVKKSPYKFAGYTRLSVKQSSLESGDATPYTTNFLQAGYGLTDTKTISIRQEFDHAFAENDTILHDTFIGYSDTNLATFAEDGSLTGVARLYLPTGDASRTQTNQNGAVLGWLIASKPFGKWDFGYNVLGVYFNQTQDTYLNDEGKPETTSDYEIDQWAAVTYNFTEKVSLTQEVGTDNIWSRPGPAGIERSHKLALETILTYKPIKELSVSGSVYNSANIWNSPNPFGFYRGDETSYRLALAASM